MSLPSIARVAIDNRVAIWRYLRSKEGNIFWILLFVKIGMIAIGRSWWIPSVFAMHWLIWEWDAGMGILFPLENVRLLPTIIFLVRCSW